MNNFPNTTLSSRISTPVKREGAARYLLITLLSFAVSVILTRLFLYLTGYPQVGNGTLHIAHVLWGGLLLFVASLLPLLVANRWAYTAGALLSGAGVGLFIDEVGKFITQSNDYFFPAAAPIIYAFFLLTVMIYLQARRPPSREARAELYRALEMLQEVLDHDLNVQERAALQAQLLLVIQEATSSDLVDLAKSLLTYLQADTLSLVPDTPNLLQRTLVRARAFETRWVGRRVFKAVLVVSLGVVGLLTFSELTALPFALISPQFLENLASETLRGRLNSASNLTWFLARLGLEGSVGLLLLVAAILLLLGREQRAVSLGSFGLVISLTTVNLLVFYFDQFTTVIATLIQFTVLMSLLRYRYRFLLPALKRALPA